MSGRGGCASCFAHVPPPAAEAAAREPGGHGHGRRERYAFTVMGTTDLRGNVFNWDYATDAEFDDAADHDVGLAKISTRVNQCGGRKAGSTPC